MMVMTPPRGRRASCEIRRTPVTCITCARSFGNEKHSRPGLLPHSCLERAGRGSALCLPPVPDPRRGRLRGHHVPCACGSSARRRAALARITASPRASNCRAWWRGRRAEGGDPRPADRMRTLRGHLNLPAPPRFELFLLGGHGLCRSSHDGLNALRRGGPEQRGQAILGLLWPAMGRA